MRVTDQTCNYYDQVLTLTRFFGFFLVKNHSKESQIGQLKKCPKTPADEEALLTKTMCRSHGFFQHENTYACTLSYLIKQSSGKTLS